ncbi:Serine--pyruvate aminotransferase, mitochondrial [Armadillidium vulgare]|nr:Serine--pyruvate aminotransferase, mitochondrial [Armadillidium vulgare]
MENQLQICGPTCLLRPVRVPHKLLLGPGPSNVSERVLRSMTSPMLGHLHPEFLKIMDDVKEGLKYLFQTEARNVFCISGTGHAGMDSVMMNILEERDVILIAKNGIWGDRAADMAQRQGAVVRIIEKKPGEAFAPEELEEGLQKFRPKAFFIVHVESSTGIWVSICSGYSGFSGRSSFFMDKWLVDISYTGSQKVLSCPPSLAPVAVSDRANESDIRTVVSLQEHFYFDYSHLANYWGCDDACKKNLAWRAPTVTTIVVPQGINWKEASEHLMNKYKVEISGGLGPTAGKVWRIGLLGENCTKGNVEFVLRLLSDYLSNKDFYKSKL